MSLVDKYRKDVDQFITVCRRLSQLMYVTSQGGNLAVRLEENLLLITPTLLNKGLITAEDVVFIDAKGGHVEGKRKSTGETPMYLNFFRERPDIKAVLHCHPPYTNAFAISKAKNWLMRPIFPETTTEVGPVPIVPYGEPLTQRLADNFLPFLKKYDAFLMESHGLVIMSKRDIEWVMALTEILEMTSMSLVSALSFGEVKEISREDMEGLENVRVTRKLPLPGLPGEHKSLIDLYYE